MFGPSIASHWYVRHVHKWVGGAYLLWWNWDDKKGGAREVLV